MQIQEWANAPMWAAWKDKRASAQGRAFNQALRRVQSILQQSFLRLHVIRGHPPSSPTRHSGEHMIISLRLSSRNSRACSKFHLCHVLSMWRWPSNQLQSHSPCTCLVCTLHQDASPAPWRRTKTLIHTSFIKLTSHMAQAQRHFSAADMTVTHLTLHSSAPNRQRDFNSHSFDQPESPRRHPREENLN